jgi:ABC-type Fe3+ transport system permease subunit
LGFLQAVWDKDRNLARFSALGLLFLSIGLILAGASSYFRHEASLAWQYRAGTRSHRFWHYASYSVQFSSLGAFSVGVLVVVLGALSLL